MNYKELKQEWAMDLPRCSERQWLLVFPDSKKRVKKLIKGYSSLAEKLGDEIRNDLSAIYKLKADNFSTWFCEEIIKIWKGNRLDGYIKKIRRLKSALIKLNNKREITNLQIQKARDYPFEMLVPEVRKDFAICPFHSERNASFYIKGNYGFCFGCGWKGDPIDFIQEKEGVNFLEAVKRLQ